MASEHRTLLEDIVEVGETLVGGRVRWKEGAENHQGKSISKVSVIGAVQRGGRVYAEVAKNRTGRDIVEFINRVSSISETTLITDQFPAYKKILATVMEHLIISHTERYVDGMVHTNTTEGFWSQLKRA